MESNNCGNNGKTFSPLEQEQTTPKKNTAAKKASSACASVCVSKVLHKQTKKNHCSGKNKTVQVYIHISTLPTKKPLFN